MSEAVLERSPIRWRWWALRRSSGRSSGAMSSISTGTPISTSSPSGTEVASRIAATSTNETTAPANRAETSMTCPMLDRSLVPIATTSPVETLRGSVPPRCTVWRETSWTVRYAAVSQLVTANRCRMMPLTACTSPIASITPAYMSSAWPSLADTPRSIARPITAGITACALIQTMPQAIPSTRVCHWPLATHHRNRLGDLTSAVPGWSRGRRRTPPSLRSGTVRQRIINAVSRSRNVRPETTGG